MSEGAELIDPSNLNSGHYIGHHLENLTVGSGFWTFNLDTLGFSIGLGVLFTGLFWLVGRKATVGVPGRWQNFVEWVVEFIDEQVHNSFHLKNRLVAPLALTIFVWVLLFNMMDVIPVDLLPWMAALVTGTQYMVDSTPLKIVPSTDLNMTLALALTVFLLLFVFTFMYKGPVKFLKEIFFHPFGKWLAPANVVLWVIETVARPISLSLRLFGNMYAGELLFILIVLTIPSFRALDLGLLGVVIYPLLNLVWSGLHLVVGLIQAFVFMTLTVVYLSLVSEEH